MSALTDLKMWQWSPEVLAYAAKFNVTDYLEPLREAAARLFPTGSLRVYLEDDPEIRDFTFLIFEVSVPEQDVPNYREAKRRWTAEFLQIHTRPRQCPFVLSLLTSRS